MRVESKGLGLVGVVAALWLWLGLGIGISAQASEEFRPSVQTLLYTADEFPRESELTFRERCRIEADAVTLRLREVEAELGGDAADVFEARTARVDSGGVAECWLLVKSVSVDFGVRHRAGATHRGRRTPEACAVELEALRAEPGVVVARVVRWADLFRVACRATAVQLGRLASDLR